MSKSAENRLVGSRIRAARKDAGLTLQQLADMTGITLHSIANIETGHRRPGRDRADLIAAAVGVPVRVLIGAGELAGKPLIQRGPRGASWSVEYFWQRVDRRGPDECWPWTEGVNDKGYGSLTFRAKAALAHRVAYELGAEPIPDGLEVDHTCHDPDVCQAPFNECSHRRCCNPAHLEPVTLSANRSKERRRLRVPRAVQPPGFLEPEPLFELEAAS